ncbi:hypothetical protein ACVWYU_000229 [Pseudomonas sp. TE12234]
MISDRLAVKVLVLLGALLSMAVAPTFAFADAQSELRQFIQDTPELRAVFGGSAVDAISPLRAEISTTRGSARHAVVLFESTLKIGIGEAFCHAALGGADRIAWLSQLEGMPNSDGRVAEVLATERSVKSTMRNVEYHSLNSPSGWESGVCVVKLSDLNSTYPELPDQAMVRAATYQLGKQLFAAGRTGEALDRFKSLKLDSKIYPNALLYIVVILDKENPAIADALRNDYVDLSKVTDVDALGTYVQFCVTRKLLKEARAGEFRCVVLGSRCYKVPADR